MSDSGRRAFLKQAALAAAGTAAGTAAVSATPGNAVAAVPNGSSPPAAGTTQFDPALLGALADALLPESLGTAGRATVVREFTAWIAGYRPVSEEMHGYGNQEITYSASDPAPGWNAQLSGLDLLARRKQGKGFAALDVAARRALLAAPLGRAAARLPGNPIAAPHVAIALLAFWADSPAATDLAYGARIGREGCRVLADSPRKPLPLAAQPTR